MRIILNEMRTTLFPLVWISVRSTERRVSIGTMCVLPEIWTFLSSPGYVCLHPVPRRDDRRPATDRHVIDRRPASARG